MAMTADTTTGESHSPPGVRPRTDPGEKPVVSRAVAEAPDQLALLADDYAREILQALGGGPKRGRDLVADCEGSRATVYRRLDRLADAGLVRAETALDPDGHHAKEFRLVRDTLAVTVEDGGLTVTARS